MDDLSIVETLRTVNETVRGFGVPSENTKFLVSSGYVELENVENGHWVGRLTKKGQKVLNTKKV